jgi:hypothetical protein
VGDQQEGGQGVQAARALADVVAEAGPGAWADAGRLEALLQARLGEGSGSALAQVKVLARAAARGVPAGLRSKTPAAGLVQQLVEWEGLDPAVAEWSVRTWEWALGVLPSSSEVAAAPAPAPAAPVTDLAATTAVGRALPPPGTGRVASIPPPAGSRSAPAPERGRNGGLVVLLAAGVAALVLAAVALGVVLLRDDPVTTEVITAAEQPATTSSTTTSTTSTSTSTTTTSTTTQPTQPPTTQPTQPPTTQPAPPPPPSPTRPAPPPPPSAGGTIPVPAWYAVVASDFVANAPAGSARRAEIQGSALAHDDGHLVLTDDYHTEPTGVAGEPPNYYPREGVVAAVVGPFPSQSAASGYCASVGSGEGSCSTRQFVPR